MIGQSEEAESTSANRVTSQLLCLDYAVVKFNTSRPTEGWLLRAGVPRQALVGES
jgi:hypothetical protein